MLRTAAIFSLLIGCLGTLSACGATTPPANLLDQPIDADGGRTAVENPSGDCQPSGDGARLGYHSADGSQWLVDCSPVHSREYWRVFAQGDGTAYLIPRPDGDPSLAAVCDGPLSETAQAYSLCDAQPDVERVNAMKPSDALTIAHALHRDLRFRAQGKAVLPFPVPSDISDACQSYPEVQEGTLQTVCELALEPPMAAPARELSEDEAIQLAALMNRLYGIDG